MVVRAQRETVTLVMPDRSYRRALKRLAADNDTTIREITTTLLGEYLRARGYLPPREAQNDLRATREDVYVTAPH